MLYQSTRGDSGCYRFDEVVSRGLAPDGGLFLPQTFPDIRSRLSAWKALDYAGLCDGVVALYDGATLEPQRRRKLIDDALRSFRHPEIAPTVCVGPARVLELFHGPTYSFKDVALQLLGQLFQHWPGERGLRTIVGATSGDTGSAAIQAVAGKSGIRIFILYPEGRVSPLQERQMTTVAAGNVHCLALKGSFDDCQTIVKELFAERELVERLGISAVNSINWARILAQVVYYVYAYLRWVGEQGCRIGEPLSFCVPTGNFGDIFAGYVAKCMGLPISRLIIATNENDILTRFHQTGTYNMREVVPTSSPSMDIQISSNFERLLYLLWDRDATKVGEAMGSLKRQGSFEVTEPLLKAFRSEFSAAAVSEAECRDTMRRFARDHDYQLDPHSAVGMCAALKTVAPGEPFVTLATAHPAKFVGAVERANGRKYELPEELGLLEKKPVRKTILPAELGAVRAQILEGTKNDLEIRERGER